MILTKWIIVHLRQNNEDLFPLTIDYYQIWINETEVYISTWKVSCLESEICSEAWFLGNLFKEIMGVQKDLRFTVLGNSRTCNPRYQS